MQEVRAATLQILPTTPTQYGMPGKSNNKIIKKRQCSFSQILRQQKTVNKLVNCFLPSVVFDETFSFIVIEICSLYWPVSEFIDPVFAKTSPSSFSMSENKRFRENWVYKFGHRCRGVGGGGGLQSFRPNHASWPMELILVHANKYTLYPTDWSGRGRRLWHIIVHCTQPGSRVFEAEGGLAWPASQPLSSGQYTLLRLLRINVLCTQPGGRGWREGGLARPAGQPLSPGFLYKCTLHPIRW